MEYKGKMGNDTAASQLIIWICFLLLQCISSFAQQGSAYIFHHINESDGLLHTRVTCIVQDGKGYMWILTNNGLQRYDGSRFVNYPYDLNNPAGIIDTRWADLFADKKKNSLWIIDHDRNIEQLDLKKNTFTLYDADSILKNRDFKFDSYTDSLNNIWLAGDFGIYSSDNGEKKLHSIYLSNPSLAPNQSNYLLIDRENEEIWLATFNGLVLLDKKTKKVYTHAYNPIHHPLLEVMSKGNLSGIMQDSEHTIWISTGRPFFFRYNMLSKKLWTYSLNDINKSKSLDLNQDAVANVQCFFEDNHHTIWIGTSNAGLLQYNREKDSFTSIINEEKNKLGLHYNYDILNIFQDKEENIWLGTDKGISIFNPYRQYFQSIHYEEGNPLSLTKNEIDDFIQTVNGDILCGTWGGGLTLYDSNWNFKKNISFPPPDEYNLIWSFIQNDDGTIWAGCQHGFIHIYNPSTQTISTIRPPEVNNYTIRSMAKDKKGNIWMGLHNGKIAKWDKGQKKFFPYNDIEKGIVQAFSPVLNIFFDSKQRCWVSTETGLKQFDTEKRMYLAVYLPDKKNLHSISANTSGGIEEFNDSTLVIGTMYGGLNFFNTNTRNFTHLSTNDGLPSNTICSLKKDAANYLWLTTEYGLYKFRRDDKKFIPYTIEPGTINSAFKATGFYPLHDGRWITSTATEMICFHPEKTEHQNNNTAKVEITGFMIFDSSVFIDPLLAANKPVQLDYKQNFLTIEFSVLNFSNFQQTGYYYHLSSVDKDWVAAGIKKFAGYTNLQPGEYIFSVKADNGSETTHTTSFQIIIIPPFWKTWWFISLCLLVAGLSISWLVRKRIKTIRHEAELKQKLTETEMMALRAQMNPHFIFNCLNSIDNLIQIDEKEKATLYLAKFAKLIRSILENSKNNVVPCWKDLETLKLYIELEELRCDKKFTCQLKITDEILNGDYKVPPLVIQPFVENAIHHGLMNKIDADKKLTIDVFVKNKNICYCIEDNGVGRKKAAAYKEMNKLSTESMGMQITTDRINLFNQNKNGSVKITDLLNENNEALGTRVEVELVNQS